MSTLLSLVPDRTARARLSAALRYPSSGSPGYACHIAQSWAEAHEIADARAVQLLIRN